MAFMNEETTPFYEDHNHPDDPVLDDGSSTSAYPNGLPVSDIYQTGGYWFAGTQTMNVAFESDVVADVAFDPLEELIWCISRMGQLTSFYSVSMDRYTTTTIPLLTNESTGEFGDLKQVYPSPRSTEHSVYVLASNAIHAYTKFGRPFACASNKMMQDLECLAVTGPTGATPGTGFDSGSWGVSGEMDYSRIFLGGLQPTLLELDAKDRWGEIIRTVDVGVGGSVVLRSFSSGLCAGTTNGKVIVIDPRTSQGIVRELDAHTGEISDVTVVPHGYTLVTCGWSRLGEAGLRVDRLLKVYDLRSGRAQVPLSASLDPCFARFHPGCTDRLFAASQAGGFQTIQWGNRAFSPDDLGQLWPSYDRLVALDISNNGNCVIFGTETGHLQLYLQCINLCQFNTSSLPTEFASPLAESLWPTNNLAGSMPPAYPLMLMDDPANPLYGTHLISLGRCAAEAVELQMLSASIHQPAVIASDNLRTAEAFELVERRKAEAATEAVLTAYKPVDFDDYRFSFSSVPFIAHPTSASLIADSPDLSRGTPKSTKTAPQSLSDWPADLCQTRTRSLVPLDPDLITNVNRNGSVRKPLHWGSVWHPYSDDILSESKTVEDDVQLGRFVSMTAKDSPSVT